MGVLNSIRKWIDGESAEDLIEAADEQSRPRRVWEEFLVKIAREVERVMQQEMFTPPGGPTYIPREYVVYLSSEDDKEWQGDKRRGLEQGLFNVLSDRARELSGSTQLAAKSLAVELRVDGTLNKGEFRVQGVWDETGNQTTVTPRPELAKTIGITPAPTDSVIEGTEGEGEQTVVRSRPTVLYQIEIWRNGVRETVVPVTRAEITIGRGSRSITVDLPLKGDPEVSRVHATLTRNSDGRYWVFSKGRNPTFVDGQEVPRGESVEVRADQKISFCTFVLRIQPQ